MIRALATAGLLLVGGVLVAISLLSDGVLVATLQLTDLELRPVEPARIAIWRIRVLCGVVGLTFLLTAGATWRFPGPLRRAGAHLSATWHRLRDSAREGWSALTRVEALTLAVVVVSGIAARVLIARLPVSFDEAITYTLFASRSLGDVLTDYGMPNNHIAHSVLVWASVRLFGAGDFTVRIPALVAGVILLPVVFTTVHRLAGAQAAAAATLLVAVAPPLVEYSAQGRGYTLSALLSVGALLVLVHRQRPTAHANAAVAGILMALALWTVPTALMAVMAVGLWWLVDERSTAGTWPLRPATTLALLALGVSLSLYAPAVARSGLGALVGNQMVQPMASDRLLAAVPEVWSTIASCFTGRAPWAGGGIAIVAAGFVIRDRKLRSTRWLLIAALAAPMLIVVGRRVFPPARALIGVYVLVLIAVSVGLVTALSQWSPIRRRALVVPLLGALALAWMGWWAYGVTSVSTGADYDRFGRSAGDPQFCCREGIWRHPAQEVAEVVQQEQLPLVRPLYSGSVWLVRFYLRSQGEPASLVVPFRENDPVMQLAPYPEFLIVADGEDVAGSLSDLVLLSPDSIGVLFDFDPALSPPAPPLARVRWALPPPEAEVRRWASRPVLDYPW